MATTISGNNGVSQVQDGIVTDGKLDLTANSAEVKEALNASGTAPIYACRAWVNFDGTGTVSIRASGNVSSITDSGTGDYTVNFTTAMPDVNYSTVLGASESTSAVTPSGSLNYEYYTNSASTTSVRVQTGYDLSGSNYTYVAADMGNINVAIFR